MNRIIIIGNGFDKAHGLQTSYGDFMEFLKNSIAKYRENDDSSLTLETNGIKCTEFRDTYHRNHEGKEDDWICIKKIKNKTEFEFVTNPHSQKSSYYFDSLFKKNKKINQWSDLEAHYFETIYMHKTNIDEINTINEEFEHLANLLESYLTKNVEEKTGNKPEAKYKLNIENPIFDIILKDRFYINGSESELIFKKTHLISFNYTSKFLDYYLGRIRNNYKRKNFFNTIHIHGRLNKANNPIVFGYGDENSDKYNELELLGNDGLLKNFKTFKYLRTNNYANALGLLLGKEDIYIQLIGHSCGLCDKALLRTIFQHDNVKHIEPCYHVNESKYFEKLYNISRIFDDNSLMREKIIPLENTQMTDKSNSTQSIL